jgi:AraC-like DNA-binding protein
MLAGKYVARWQSGERSGRIAARTADVVLWPAYTRRIESNEPGPRMRALMAYFRWNNRIDDLPVLVHDAQHLIASLAQSLLQAKDSLRTDRRLMQNGYLAAILAEFVRLADLTSGDGLPERVAAYTQAHLRQRFGLNELSRFVGLERNYFGRRYRELTGRTPMEDVRRIRIEHAVGILRGSPRLPLKDVAFRVGMANDRLLCRWLKRYRNMTSREIRGV